MAAHPSNDAAAEVVVAAAAPKIAFAELVERVGAVHVDVAGPHADAGVVCVEAGAAPSVQSSKNITASVRSIE